MASVRASLPRPAAVLFDFNGTLSCDEEILFEIFADLFSERGRVLDRDRYFAELAGLSDREIVSRFMGSGFSGVESLLLEHGKRYRGITKGGETISEGTRAAVRLASKAVPIGVVSGASRRDVEAVLKDAGILPFFSVIVALEDVAHGKPHPEGYERALIELGGSLRPSDVLVFEDSQPGVDAALAAGMRCVGIGRIERQMGLNGAEETAPLLTEELVARLLAVPSG
ncbi:MAG: HAD family hydrolase [Acidimicrobiales bacterium]